MTRSADRDVSLSKISNIPSYREFLKLFADRNFIGLTHAEWFDGTRAPKILLLRHDVDFNLERALAMARIENSVGVRSTYFLLPPGDSGNSSNYYGSIRSGKIVLKDRLKKVACEIQALGHEVGIHNDFLQLGHILGRPPRDLLVEQIAALQEVGIDVVGSASHGSKFAKENGIKNYQMFEEYRRDDSPESVDLLDGSSIELFRTSYRELGLRYEAYEAPCDVRIADIGGLISVFDRTVKPRKKLTLEGNVDLGQIGATAERASVVIALIHPDWWAPDATAKRKFLDWFTAR